MVNYLMVFSGSRSEIEGLINENQLVLVKILMKGYDMIINCMWYFIIRI